MEKSTEKKDPIVASDKIDNEIITQFINAQEPLGEEFKKVLRENLWDLYEK